MLLIDETDKADVEVEGLLLEVLSDFQVTIPELGTITAERRPMVVLTSNATRELSEALKRRCLYLALDYPSAEREREIVLSRVPDLAPGLAEQLVRTVRALRALELKKSPSISETLDWAQTLLELGLDTLDESAMRSTLGVVLKHASDQDAGRRRAAAELMSPTPAARVAEPGGLAGHLDGFVRAVREAGIPVGISQAVDAAEILTVVDLLDREQLRHGLAAVLLQRAAQRPTYDVLFDLWWPLSDRPASRRRRRRTTARRRRAGRSRPWTLPGSTTPTSSELMRAQLLAAAAWTATRRRCAGSPGMAVERLGRGQPSPSGQSFFSYRVLRALSPDTLVSQLLAGLLAEGDRGGLAEQVARQTVKERLAAFRAAIEAEVRRRTAAEKGRDKVAKNAVRPLADQVDFLRAQAGRPGRAAAGGRAAGPAAGRAALGPATARAARAGWTSARPCGPRWAPAACRW